MSRWSRGLVGLALVGAAGVGAAAALLGLYHLDRPEVSALYFGAAAVAFGLLANAVLRD